MRPPDDVHPMEQRGACRHCQAQCRCASKRLEEGQADPHARAHKTRSQEGRPCVARAVTSDSRQRASPFGYQPSLRVARMYRCHCVVAGCAPADRIARACACYYGYHLRAGPQIITVHAPKGMGAKKPPKPAAAAPGSAAVVIKQRSFMAASGATQATVAVQNRNLGCAALRQLSELSTNWGSAVRWPV